MNPVVSQKTDFLLRRLSESFADWSVAFPVLFALLVVYLMALFRKQSGGTVLSFFCTLGMLLVVPLNLMFREEGPNGNFLHDVLIFYLLEVLASAFIIGFTFSLIQVITGKDKLSKTALILGALPGALYFTYAEAAIPLHYKILPFLGLFALQVVLWCWRSGMLLGLLGVAVISGVYVPLALLFKPIFSWFVVLAPVLLVALLYVGLMYIKDAKSIHPAWSAFLGVLRVAVYAILGFVFLLPGCQTYDIIESPPKVVALFDVSGSMNTVDDLPKLGQDPTTLPTRQDKVIQFLTRAVEKDGKSAPAFIDQVLQKTPLTAYRFGGTLDKLKVVQLAEGQSWPADDLTRWLKPDAEIDLKRLKIPDNVAEDERTKQRHQLTELIESLISGTDVGGSALQAATLEKNHYVQAIVLISDGQSNRGSDDAVKAFLAHAGNPQRPIQVYTIGVGDYRQPATIKIDDLQAPEIARPDDKFPVRVPVIGSGLQDEEFEVWLDVTRIEDNAGKPVEDKTHTLGPKTGKFKGGGDNPHDTVEFDISVEDLKEIKSDKDEAGLLEGTWKFVARVPRHAREAFAKAEHISDPATRVLVQKKKLRVLLFAGGPNRDYQFVRTLFYREVAEKRVEMSVFLQTGRDDDVDQDVEKDRLLTHFPNRLGPDNPNDKYSSLNEYDVVIAYDPDWTLLDVDQLRNLEKWVDKDGGSVVFVAGPVHTFHLARPGGLDLSALLTLLPVTLKDSRLHGLGLGHDPTRPYHLNFTPAAKLYDFLKLDETGDSPTAGWDYFFWSTGPRPAPGKDVRPVRGFFNYYPVEKLKQDSRVLAYFAGPPTSRLEDGSEQPYIVTMRYGTGKTFYVGSPETWRLRQYKEAFHERFWIKLARFAASGTTPQKKYGRIVMGRTALTGVIPFEAQIKGDNLLPLAQGSRPTVEVRKVGDREGKPELFDLKAKPTQAEWNGWFVGNFKIREPGEYEFSVPIPGTPETLKHTLNVRRPNLELDNVRENFLPLFAMASTAETVLSRLPQELRTQVEPHLKPPEDIPLDSTGKLTKRLFFRLSDADAVAQCLTKLTPKRDPSLGKFEDLWDRGWTSGYSMSAYHVFLLAPLFVAAFAAAIFSYLYWSEFQPHMQTAGKWPYYLLIAACAVTGITVTPQIFREGYPLDFLGEGLGYVFGRYAIDFLGGMGLGVLGGGIYMAVYLLVRRGHPVPIITLGLLGLALFGVFLTNELFMDEATSWLMLPVDLSFVLVTVVGLLSLEWLTRKLLKLA